MLSSTKLIRILAALVAVANGVTADSDNATGEDVCSTLERKICLNMIVKNEERVMPRLIESVKDVIDYYVIVDTGSTDSTMDLIPKEMEKYGVSGKVFQQEWVNYGTNRDQALKLAMEHCNSGWALFIDADDELVVNNATQLLESLDVSKSYQIEKWSHGMRYALHNLINIHVSKGWGWRGVVHEYIDSSEVPSDHEFQTRDDVHIKVNVGEGYRSANVTDEEKFLKDAKLLEDDLIRNPDDPRSLYYLGQSYRDAGHKEKALVAFRRRVEVGGWVEETFWAQYQIGMATEELFPDNETAVVTEYMAAYEMRPSRIEPLLRLARYFHYRERFARAYLYASIGAHLKIPKDILFLHTAGYQWEMLDELCVIAYYVDNQLDEGVWACETVLERAEELNLPKYRTDQYKKNLEFYHEKKKTLGYP